MLSAAYAVAAPAVEDDSFISTIPEDTLAVRTSEPNQNNQERASTYPQPNAKIALYVAPFSNRVCFLDA